MMSINDKFPKVNVPAPAILAVLEQLPDVRNGGVEMNVDFNLRMYARLDLLPEKVRQDLCERFGLSNLEKSDG